MCARLTNISNAWDLIPLLFPYCSQYNSLLYSIISTLTKMRDNHAGCVIVDRSGVRICEGVGSYHKKLGFTKKSLSTKKIWGWDLVPKFSENEEIFVYYKRKFCQMKQQVKRRSLSIYLGVGLSGQSPKISLEFKNIWGSEKNKVFL